MNEQSDARYTYHQDARYPPSFYPQAPSNSHSSHYHSHPDADPTRSADNAVEPASYSFPAQWPSLSPLSPSNSSTDPELKRIRNTAASARFRAKKKRREASLERSAEKKREALEMLENRRRELEAENQFLKGLIFDREKLEGVKTGLERARKLKEELEVGKEEGERDDGVGTRKGRK